MGHYYAEMFPNGPDKEDFESLRKEHLEEEKNKAWYIKALNSWWNEKWKRERESRTEVTPQNYTPEDYERGFHRLIDEHARMEKQLALALGYQVYVEKDIDGNEVEIPGWGDHVLASLIDEACKRLKGDNYENRNN